MCTSVESQRAWCQGHDTEILKKVQSRRETSEGSLRGTDFELPGLYDAQPWPHIDITSGGGNPHACPTPAGFWCHWSGLGEGMGYYLNI